MLPWIIIIILVLCYFFVWRKRNSVSKVVPYEDRKIDEAFVNERQEYFEKNMDKNLSGSLSPQEVYIHKNLMSPWYKELSAKYRYDEKMIERIRADWLTYMTEQSSARASIFLSLESDDETETETYWEEAVLSGKKAMAIEDAFASSIGDSAKEELKKIRSYDSKKFGKDGKIAPEGYIYDFLYEEIIKEN